MELERLNIILVVWLVLTAFHAITNIMYNMKH